MKENSICRDNRFEIIEKAKEKLLNATNIEDSKEETKVLTNILFRMWQAGLINEEKLEINKLQKENSREEDIKILKELGQKYYKNGEIKIKALSGAKYIWTLQNLLSDYKRVLKENEELKNDYENLSNSVVVKNHCIKNSIPVSLVEEMIEELEQERTLKYDNYMGYKIESREQQDIDKKVQILQELLEKRK